MYTYVYGRVKQYLLSNNYNPEEILSKYEVPKEDAQFFARLFWTYGNTSFSSNNISMSNDMFVIELYERKMMNSTVIEEALTDIRRELLALLKNCNYNGKFCRITNISINENFNDENWKAYSIIINFNVFEGDNV